jgi:hypothetical protein
MGFASGYLEERALFPEFVKEAPDKDTGIIIVVPSYDEPGISRLLDSLSLCIKVPCKVEVLIVVNAPENASDESIGNNRLTIENIEIWKQLNINCFFRVYIVHPVLSPVSGWGVGLARKTGMDEAVRRFDTLNRPCGVILNLDADCLVDQNYLVAVFNDFLLKRERAACSIRFAHPLSGDDFPGEVFRYITLYELHLRYYFQGLIISGFPYVFHTVGSAMGVKALPYIRAGGMNRKQAGEDFYFIQKLVPEGEYFSLNTTAVHPSPRPSFRVPFGTGASVTRLTTKGDTLLLTYNIMAFKELGTFFRQAEEYYARAGDDFEEFYTSLPEGIRSFIPEKELSGKLTEIRNNTSGFHSFRKRFFGWFNMFRIVKYLNHVHSGIFEKVPVQVASCKLLAEKGIRMDSDDPGSLLEYFRSLELQTLSSD